MIYHKIEFNKGILFVRIRSNMSEQEYKQNKNDIKEIIKRIGIKYLVLNFEEIKEKNTFSLKLILNNYKLIKKYNGKLLLCGYEDHRYIDNKDILFIKNELEAFKKINI